MQRFELIYRYLESPLGNLIIGVTSEGCCLLEFQDRYNLPQIRARYKKSHNAECVRGVHPFLEQMESELEDYFQGNLQSFTVPLDLKGTPFEMKVWKKLLEIPYGETRSYAEIARAIGNPAAVRAVGRANGRNPVVIIVPCHRVIASNGTLHGYGGGTWRKEKLLALESRRKTLRQFFDISGN